MSEFNFDIVSMKVKSQEGVLLEVKMTPSTQVPVVIDSNFLALAYGIQQIGNVVMESSNYKIANDIKMLLTSHGIKF